MAYPAAVHASTTGMGVRDRLRGWGMHSLADGLNYLVARGKGALSLEEEAELARLRAMPRYGSTVGEIYNSGGGGETMIPGSDGRATFRNPALQRVQHLERQRKSYFGYGPRVNRPVVAPPPVVARNIPAGTSNFITADDIGEGDLMTNFYTDDRGTEATYGRYYRTSTVGRLPMHPLTRGEIRDRVNYRAHLVPAPAGGFSRKNQKSRKSRKGRKGQSTRRR